MTPEAKALFHILRRIGRHYPKGISLSSVTTLLLLPARTREVAEQLNVTRDHAHKLIHLLVEGGLAKSDQVYKNATYSLTARGEAVIADISPTARHDSH